MSEDTLPGLYVDAPDVRPMLRRATQHNSTQEERR
jgi:hypothetical protein